MQSTLFGKQRRRFKPAFGGEALESREMLSAAAAGASSDEEWLQRLYLSTVQRVAGNEELAYWTQRLDAGANHQAIASAVVGSREYRTLTLSRHYDDILSRQIDASGLEYWLGVWDHARGSEVIRASLLGSNEFFGNAGSSVDAAVDNLYDEVLERAPAAAELDYWRDVVGRAPLAQVALGFVQSDEARTKHVDAWYHEYLHRRPSAPECQYWTQLVRSGLTHEQVQASLLASNESAAIRFLDAGDGGANGRDGLEDTSQLQNALAQAKSLGRTVVYIPAGTFVVDGLSLDGSFQKLIGPGTLKLKSGSQQRAALIVNGDDNLVIGLEIDGNGTALPSGRGEGVAILGDRNLVRDVVARDTSDVTLTGNTFVVLGDRNIVEGCTSLRAGYAGFRHAGTGNEFRHIVAIDYVNKGFVHNGNGSQLLIDGYYGTTSRLTAQSSILLDADPNGNSKLISAVLRNVVAYAPSNTDVHTNAAKFAQMGTLVIERSQFLHDDPAMTSVRIAEAVQYVTIRDSFMSRNLKFQSVGISGLSEPPELVVLSHVRIGDGRHRSTHSLIYADPRRLIISNCELVGFTQAAIGWQGTADQYDAIAALNTRFDGFNSSRPTYDIAMMGAGEILATRLSWTDNSRSNAAGGGALPFPSATGSGQ